MESHPKKGCPTSEIGLGSYLAGSDKCSPPLRRVVDIDTKILLWRNMRPNFEADGKETLKVKSKGLPKKHPTMLNNIVSIVNLLVITEIMNNKYGYSCCY